MKKEYAVIVIKTDDTVQLIGLDDYHLNLQQLYAWTCCDTIQIVRLASLLYNPYALMCIDDNGKVLNKPLNLLATLLYGQYPNDFIVGDVVIGTSWTDNKFDEPDIYALKYDEALKIYKMLIDFLHMK